MITTQLPKVNALLMAAGQPEFVWSKKEGAASRTIAP